jgi:hypothetical protein
MEIYIKGKFESSNYSRKELKQISWIENGFVFVDYLPDDIAVGDVFTLENGEEIILIEIKLQFETKESLTAIGKGWKCLCKFENLDLKNIPSTKDWYDSATNIIAKKKAE